METSPLVIIYWKIVHGLLTFELWWNTIFTDAYWWWTEWSKRRPVLNGWFRQIRDHSKKKRCFSWIWCIYPIFKLINITHWPGGYWYDPHTAATSRGVFSIFWGPGHPWCLKDVGNPKTAAFFNLSSTCIRSCGSQIAKPFLFAIYLSLSLSISISIFVSILSTSIYLYPSLSISIYFLFTPICLYLSLYAPLSNLSI